MRARPEKLRAARRARVVDSRNSGIPQSNSVRAAQGSMSLRAALPPLTCHSSLRVGRRRTCSRWRASALAAASVSPGSDDADALRTQLERERRMSAAAKAELLELRASFTRLQDDAEELATRLLYALEEEKLAKQQLSALVEPAKQRASTSAGVAERQLQASVELLKTELQASATQLARAVAERDAALARCAEMEAAVGVAASSALSDFEETEIRGRRGGGEADTVQPPPFRDSGVVPEDIMERLRRRNAKRDTLNLDVADPWR